MNRLLAFFLDWFRPGPKREAILLLPIHPLQHTCLVCRKEVLKEEQFCSDSCEDKYWTYHKEEVERQENREEEWIKRSILDDLDMLDPDPRD